MVNQKRKNCSLGVVFLQKNSKEKFLNTLSLLSKVNTVGSYVTHKYYGVGCSGFTSSGNSSLPLRIKQSSTIVFNVKPVQIKCDFKSKKINLKREPNPTTTFKFTLPNLILLIYNTRFLYNSQNYNSYILSTILAPISKAQFISPQAIFLNETQHKPLQPIVKFTRIKNNLSVNFFKFSSYYF